MRGRDDESSCCASGGPLDLAGVQTTGAHLDLDDLSFRPDDASDLKVRTPRTARLVVGVRNVVSERDALAAGITAAAIDGHCLRLHQFDTRHLGAVALAVTRLENAGVAAFARREL